MKLKSHGADSAHLMFTGASRTDEVQQLHIMVRAVLDEHYAKPNPFATTLQTPQACPQVMEK